MLPPAHDKHLPQALEGKTSIVEVLRPRLSGYITVLQKALSSAGDQHLDRARGMEE